MLRKFIICNLIIATFVLCGNFEGAKYQAQTRQTKSSQIFTQVTANTTSAPYPNAAGLLVESMDPSLSYVSDQLPEGRVKYVHPVGSVAQAEFVPTPNNPYTGFFQGADSLIIRFSLAKEPSYKNTNAKSAYNNFAPGVAIKFLIDGQPSANTFALYSVNGIHSYNFFEEDFTNHIPPPEGLQLTIVAEKFSSGTDIIQFLGLRKFAEHTQDGKTVANPNFPFKLRFKASQEAKSKFTPNYTQDYRVLLQSIPQNATLFEVFATNNPIDNCETKVGEIRLKSHIYPSNFGDTVLFFQHQDFTNDLEVHPEWQPYTPYWKIFGNRASNKKEGKCPFSSLFD